MRISNEEITYVRDWHKKLCSQTWVKIDCSEWIRFKSEGIGQGILTVSEDEHFFQIKLFNYFISYDVGDAIRISLSNVDSRNLLQTYVVHLNSPDSLGLEDGIRFIHWFNETNANKKSRTMHLINLIKQ